MDNTQHRIFFQYKDVTVVFFKLGRKVSKRKKKNTECKKERCKEEGKKQRKERG